MAQFLHEKIPDSGFIVIGYLHRAVRSGMQTIRFIKPVHE
jgi:hypothetical protein